MWRAVFLAIGISSCILGAECLVVDKAVFTRQAEAVEQAWYEFPPPQGASNEFKPPEWAPWSLITAGAVILIYSISLSNSSES
jgi:hypothetical protein